MATLPIGTDDFREIREGDYYYIDKTLLIKDFITYKNKVALITRPRRFGKTLNMTMLREFFDLTKDSRAIFDGLAIMETEYADQLNSKPVIYLTFKNCSGANIDDLKDAMAFEMVHEYERFATEFKGKLDTENLSYFAFYRTYDALKAVFESRPKDKPSKSLVDTGLFKNSLRILIKAVSMFYNQHPILLIDEYDQPLINAHSKNFREKFSEDIYADFLGGALKGNEHLGQNLLTGIQRIAKESIFSKLNNFVVYTVIDEMYAPYFGLTEAETKVALEYVGLALTDDIKRYYDGYLMGGIGIYNPWSVLKYMFKKKLEPFWLNTSTNALIRTSILNADAEFKESFEELILDGEVEVLMNLEASFIELEEPETLWGLLVNSGYLTVLEDFGNEEYVLKIPNQEVKKEFRKIVANYTGLNSNRLNQMFNALVNCNMQKFLKMYQKLVYDYVSSHDISHRNKGEDHAKHFENSYHMFFLGMAVAVNGMYEITSNLEAGDGRGDIAMKSLQPHLRPHVLIEFKEGDNVKKLKQEALDQIFEKKYYVKLSGKVLCIGLAHSMKECELVYKEIIVDEYGTIAE